MDSFKPSKLAMAYLNAAFGLHLKKDLVFCRQQHRRSRVRAIEHSVAEQSTIEMASNSSAKKGKSLKHHAHTVWNKVM